MINAAGSMVWAAVVEIVDSRMSVVFSEGEPSYPVEMDTNAMMAPRIGLGPMARNAIPPSGISVTYAASPAT